MKKNTTILLLITLMIVTFTISCKKNVINEETQVESLSRRGFKLESREKLFSTYIKGDSITLLKRGKENAIVSESIHSYTKYWLDAGSCIMSGQMASASDDYVDDEGGASGMEELALKTGMPGITSITYTGDSGRQHNGYLSLHTGTITCYWDHSTEANFSQYLLNSAIDASPENSFRRL